MSITYSCLRQSNESLLQKVCLWMCEKVEAEVYEKISFATWFPGVVSLRKLLGVQKNGTVMCDKSPEKSAICLRTVTLGTWLSRTAIGPPPAQIDACVGESAARMRNSFSESVFSIRSDLQTARRQMRRRVNSGTDSAESERSKWSAGWKTRGEISDVFQKMEDSGRWVFGLELANQSN